MKNYFIGLKLVHTIRVSVITNCVCKSYVLKDVEKDF